MSSSFTNIINLFVAAGGLGLSVASAGYYSVVFQDAVATYIAQQRGTHRLIVFQHTFEKGDGNDLIMEESDDEETVGTEEGIDKIL